MGDEKKKLSSPNLLWNDRANSSSMLTGVENSQTPSDVAEFQLQLCRLQVQPQLFLHLQPPHQCCMSFSRFLSSLPSTPIFTGRVRFGFILRGCRTSHSARLPPPLLLLSSRPSLVLLRSTSTLFQRGHRLLCPRLRKIGIPHRPVNCTFI